MKTKLTVIMLFVSITLIAQNSINYKAVIKDNVGNVVANQTIDVQFAILQGVTTVYQETHTPITDDNGLIVLNIGEGTTSDNFTTINWGTDDHFLNVQIDTGSGLVDLGTTQFMAVPYALQAANVSGLEALDEGDGIGWRLVGANPDYYDSIGNLAVDLSISNINSDTYGATGISAFAAGAFNEASGNYSTALGRGTIASGTNSTTMGYFATASGANSIAMGYYAASSGDFSTAIGFATKSESSYSTAIGRYNIGGGSLDTWVEVDPLFEIGNSNISSARSNALTVLKNGTITAPSFDIAEITDPKALITKEYLEANVSASTGLESLDEGNGVGWRLVGIDPNDTAPVLGNKSVDLSFMNPSHLGLSDTSGITLGDHAFQAGLSNVSEGMNSATLGSTNFARGENDIAMGSNNFTYGSGAVALGTNNSSTGSASIALGNENIADDDSSTVTGKYNDNTTTTTSLFQVGNGTNSSNRSNAFVVESNGSLFAPSFDIAEITDPKALITKEYLEANASTATGLEAINEGNGIGYRLKDANPIYFGNIGDRAVDLSYGGDAGYDAGQGAVGTGSVAMGQYTTANNGSVAMGYGTSATGQYATAIGSNTTASGAFSVAMGEASTASALYATALGYNTEASGETSTAMGLETEASGENSTSIGKNTNAIGENSFAAGELTLATGKNAIAMGNGTNANGLLTTAIGRYNTGGGNSTTWVETDPLFEIGNGLDFGTKSNALTVLKNGTITAPSFDISEITDDKALITKEFADANYSGGGSGTNPTGLEAIDEGSGIGWRLIGGNPDNYGNIGENAVDLSNGTTNSALYGATGEFAFASGLSTRASGDYSTAMGAVTVASGNISTAMGSGTIADDLHSIVVGRNNDNTISTTTLFQVGNGARTSERSNAFTVFENGNATLAGILTQNSDRRLKNNIENLNYGLDEVLNLKPVSYHWKRYPDQPKSLGLIAQEVQTVINEIVHEAEDKDKTLSVSYVELIPVLIKAIQEQQEIIDSQKITIVDQSKTLENLLNRVEALETKQNNVSSVKVVSN